MKPSRAPSLLKRQVALLGLLQAFGGRCGNLDFQKQLFLYCQERSGTAPYDFVPYRFGAFSFSSYADRRRLVERGLIEAEDQHWILTESGRAVLDQYPPARESLSGFARRWCSLSGDALIAESYRRYPYYAIRSEIAEQVLRDDPEALARIHDERPKLGSAGLVTIGYEGRSLETYLNLLLLDGVTLLCDVRRNPLSRKYGFSRRALGAGCTGIGIRYEHLPNLGIASEDRRDLRTRADYAALFARYERDYLPRQAAALETINGWISAGERVALTCYELHSEQCHRRCVAKALEINSGGKLKTKHL